MTQQTNTMRTINTFPIQAFFRSGTPAGLREELQRVMSEQVLNPTSGSVPRVDGLEDATGFTLTMDVPGVEPSALQVTADDGVLTVRGSRTQQERGEGVRELFAERQSGEFVRQFRLPKSADLDSVSAHHALGVLTIRVAKIPPAQPRKISISVDAPTQAAVGAAASETLAK